MLFGIPETRDCVFSQQRICELFVAYLVFIVLYVMFSSSADSW